jgi:hypothetical protein
MKKIAVPVAIILGFMMLVGVSTLCAAEEILTNGAFFPSVKLDVPDDSAHKKYLGLPGSGSFDIPDIKAEIIIVEIFSMY